MEIYNPGAFPEGYDPQDFINKAERAIRRNPKIARILYYSKDIESFGTGLKRIADTCNTAGVRYEFKKLKSGFVVCFYRTIDSNVGEEIKENSTGKVREKYGKSTGKIREKYGNIECISEKNNQFFTRKCADNKQRCSEIIRSKRVQGIKNSEGFSGKWNFGEMW